MKTSPEEGKNNFRAHERAESRPADLYKASTIDLGEAEYYRKYDFSKDDYIFQPFHEQQDLPEEYVKAFTTIPNSLSARQTAELLDMSFEMVHNTAPEEFKGRPATIAVRPDGIAWSADTDGLMGIVYIPGATQSAIHLGDGHHKAGALKNIRSSDTLYFLKNDTIRELSEEGILTKDSLSRLSKDSGVGDELVYSMHFNAEDKFNRRTKQHTLNRKNKAKIIPAIEVDELPTARPVDSVDEVTSYFDTDSLESTSAMDSSPTDNAAIDAGFIRRDVELYAPKGPYTQEQLAREERMLAFRESSEYTDARDAYKEQDDSLAVSVARRMKVGTFAHKKTREALQDAVDTSLESYEKVAEMFDDIQIKKWKNADPGISETDIAKKLAVYHEAKQRLHGIHQRQEIHTTEKSSKYGFINKAQEWNEKIQQKYAGLSRKQKLGVAAAGIAVGGVAGFALGGFGALGGVLLVATKGYQTYAKSRSELYNVDKVSPTQLSRKGNEKTRSQNSMQKETRDSIRSAVNGRIEKADTINKRAKWMTVGSVALLGLGVAEKFGALRELGDWAREAGVPDFNAAPNNTVEDVPTADPFETNTPESDPPFDADRPDGVDDGTGRGSTGEAGTEGGDSYSWSGDALNVSSGEGWYQTFAEMGISDFADQQALLNDSELMNKLYDQGLAYPDASAGGWGMNLTFDGKMPQESLDLIADHAVEKGLVSRSIFDLAA